MGTILWQIVPIHFKTTEIVYRARLRLLWPAIRILSNLFRPCTLRFSLLQLNFWAVRSVYASTFLNEVSLSDKIGFLAVWSFFHLRILVSLVRWAVLFSGPKPFSHSAWRLNLERTSGFSFRWLPELWLSRLSHSNFDFSSCRPEGRKEMVPDSTKKLFPFPWFQVVFYLSPDRSNVKRKIKITSDFQWFIFTMNQPRILTIVDMWRKC